ncbi:MAG: hypothetical protein RL741_1379, partial [Actinomycetota bacterium]
MRASFGLPLGMDNLKAFAGIAKDILEESVDQIKTNVSENSK